MEQAVLKLCSSCAQAVLTAHTKRATLLSPLMLFYECPRGLETRSLRVILSLLKNSWMLKTHSIVNVVCLVDKLIGHSLVRRIGQSLFWWKLAALYRHNKETSQRKRVNFFAAGRLLLLGDYFFEIAERLGIALRVIWLIQNILFITS